MKSLRRYALFIFPTFFLLVHVAFCQGQSAIEGRLTEFVKQLYSEDDAIRVRFNNVPDHLQRGEKIKSISFARLPDVKGEGSCLVEIDGNNLRGRNMYVSFRVLLKKGLLSLKQAGKKGDVLRAEDVTVTETYLNGGGEAHPTRAEEIAGKVLKKDTPGGSVVTYRLVEDPVMVQKGELVNIRVESKRLVVQARGKALEKGKMGEAIRVKNSSSDREIIGKVIGNSTVLVQF
jgi:flagella basal body P-ring formation protein FlgA